MTLDRRPYMRPTAKQRRVIAGLLETGTIPKTALLLGITVAAAYSHMAAARRRTGMTTERMIYVAGTDGWFTTQEITG